MSLWPAQSVSRRTLPACSASPCLTIARLLKAVVGIVPRSKDLDVVAEVLQSHGCVDDQSLCTANAEVWMDKGDAVRLVPRVGLPAVCVRHVCILRACDGGETITDPHAAPFSLFSRRLGGHLAALKPLRRLHMHGRVASPRQ